MVHNQSLVQISKQTRNVYYFSFNFLTANLFIYFKNYPFQLLININNFAMKLVKILVLFFLATILIAIASFLYLFAPSYASKLHYRGQTINITRNEFGIPFIQAPSKSSLFYAYGWVVAEDRAFQMSFRRLVTEGRLSEFLGQQPLPLDKFMREIDISGWGQKMAARFKQQNASQFQNLQAVVDGMNDQMSKRNLPLDFYLAGIPWMNWTVSNVFKTYKLVEFSQSFNAFDQIYRSALLTNYSKEQIDKIYPSTKENWAFESRTVIQDEDIPQRLKTKTQNLLLDLKGKIGELLETLKQIENLDLMATVEGSNSWIISGQYTESGQPIIASDPHMTISIPSSFYQFEGCYYKDEKKYCGHIMSLPGSVIMYGKFDYMSVVATTIYSDNIDFYKEKVQEDKYLVEGQWRQLKIRKELIKVKTAEGIKQLQHMVRQTHRGPIINYYLHETGNFEVPNLSFQWTGANDDYSSNLHMLQLWQIESLDYILKNLPTVKIFNFNLLMITKDGHSIAQRGGWYPIRKYPEMGNYIKDGTTTDYDWLGFIPFEDRLTIVDPKAGYIVAANNRGTQQIYYNDLHKYHIYTARADRITDMIEDYIRRGVKFNADIVKKMITDTVDSYCQRILSKMLEVLPESAAYLKKFDCDFTAHSTVAPIYELFFSQLHHLIKKGNFQTVSLLSFHNNYQYLYNFIKQAQYKAENKDILKKAWQKLMKNSLLSFNSQGNQTKRWGEIHKDALYHTPFRKSKLLSHLYNRQFEGRGNMHTVNVGKMNKVSFGNYEVSHRAQNRAIFSYTGPSFWLLDTGVSECFYSKHYDDQWRLFKENRFIEIKGLEGRTADKNQL